MFSESPSSRGLGRGPFKAETRVRIPVGTPTAELPAGVRNRLNAKHVDVVPNSWPSNVRPSGKKMACSRCLGRRVRAADSGHALTRTAPQHHHLRCSKGHLPRAPGRAGVAYLGSSEIGYSLRSSRFAGRRIALRFAAAVLGHLRVRRVDSVSTQHRSFLLASLLPAFLLVSVFAVVQAQECRIAGGQAGALV